MYLVLSVPKIKEFNSVYLPKPEACVNFKPGTHCALGSEYTFPNKLYHCHMHQLPHT